MINAGLGVPHEYFNPVIMRQIAPRLGLPTSIEGLKWRCRSLRDRLPFGRAGREAEICYLEQYITALIPNRCLGGIFAAKIHFDQYLRVLANPVGRKLLDGGLFIYIFREDLLQQAVSRNFAYLTGQWGIDDTITTAPATQADLLEVKGIDRELNTLADEDRGWRIFLAKNGLSPLTVSYEQLCKDPHRFVAAIADRIGIDPATLPRDYAESTAPASKSDAALPSKQEVIRRYLTCVRNLSGLGSMGQPASEAIEPARPRALVNS